MPQCIGAPYGPGPLALALLLAIILDRAYPRHHGVLLRLHPVTVTFRVARRLAPPGSSTTRGILALVLPLTAWLSTGCLLLEAAMQVAGVWGWVAASSVILKVSLGDYLLYDTAARAARELGAGRIGEARRVVGEIVRRDTSRLGPGHLASAAIESLSENLVDAYTGPLLYTLVLGPLGGLAHRVANTVDGAIGYKTPEYLRAGRIPALLDTILNLIPSRLTAAAIALASPAAGGSPHRALRCLLESRGATDSPNHWPPMAAMAGALGVRLEKPGHYTICRGSPLPSPLDVERAKRLAAAAGALYTGIMLMVLVLAP